MLKLNDGRKDLWQWDTGRTATVDVECDVVHFSNLNFGNAPAVQVKNNEVQIPNQLLKTGVDIYAWAFVEDADGAYTKEEQVLKVNKRAKPDDYVYTETEVLSIKAVVEKALTEAKESGEFDGADGRDGKDGADGKDGLSAYEIAKLNGFEGTEEEWLESLKPNPEAVDVYWEDIVDKPFYEEGWTIEWDGTPTAESIDASNTLGAILYKVGEALTKEEILGSVCVYNYNNGSTFVIDESSIIDLGDRQVFIVFDEGAALCCVSYAKCQVTFQGIVFDFPSAGLWFIDTLGAYRTESLSKTTIKKLDNKFIDIPTIAEEAAALIDDSISSVIGSGVLT
jgi:hypothetical protein